MCAVYHCFDLFKIIFNYTVIISFYLYKLNPQSCELEMALQDFFVFTDSINLYIHFLLSSCHSHNCIHIFPGNCGENSLVLCICEEHNNSCCCAYHREVTCLYIFFMFSVLE